MIPQFIGAFIISSILMVGGSFVWPVVTKQSRPPILQAVRDEAVKTDIGKQVEEVLGAYTDSGDLTQKLSSASSQLASQAGSMMKERVQEIATNALIDEFLKRYASFPQAQQDKVKQGICAPSQ